MSAGPDRLVLVTVDGVSFQRLGGYTTAEKHWINGVARSRGEAPPYPDVDEDPARWTAAQAPTAPDLCASCGASWACEHQGDELAGMEEVAPDAPSYRDQHGPRDNAGNPIVDEPRGRSPFRAMLDDLYANQAVVTDADAADITRRMIDTVQARRAWYDEERRLIDAAMRDAFNAAFFGPMMVAFEAFVDGPPRPRFRPPAPADAPRDAEALSGLTDEAPRRRARAPPQGVALLGS